MVDAQHRGAPERHAVAERRERVLERLVAAVVVEVLGVDVGDHRDHGREAQERAVALVGLGDEQRARAEARACGARPAASTRPPTTAVGSSPAASSTCATSEVVVVLPWLPADRDAVLEAHQLGEHLGAPDHRDLAPPPRAAARGCPARTADE